MIEELKAYKQSVITEAVTKGLNPDAPMKDSGIDWIGEIPEPWKTGKISYFYKVKLGKMLQPNKISSSDTLESYFCAANVGQNTLKYEPIKQMWFSDEEKKQYDVKLGDLLVVEGGDIASCDIVKFETSGVYFQNALHRVRPIKDANVGFLRYTLIKAKSVGHIDLLCNKATIAHFTKEKFDSLIVAVPAPLEQQAIADYLDQKCSEIDQLIEIKQNKISELKEYKKSLIFEYVTGKKQVV